MTDSPEWGPNPTLDFTRFSRVANDAPVACDTLAPRGLVSIGVRTTAPSDGGTRIADARPGRQRFLSIMPSPFAVVELSEGAGKWSFASDGRNERRFRHNEWG